MGALSVPPLERYPLGTVRLIRLMAEHKKHPVGVSVIFRLKFLLKKNDLEIDLQEHLLERSPGGQHWHRMPAC